MTTKLSIELDLADTVAVRRLAKMLEYSLNESPVTQYVSDDPDPQPVKSDAPAFVTNSAITAEPPAETSAAQAFGGSTEAPKPAAVPAPPVPPAEAPAAEVPSAGTPAISASDSPTTAALSEVPNANKSGYPKLNEHGVQVDGLGLPWDSRINTDSKVCLAKKPNEWKVIRKTPPETVEQVRAELRAALSAPAPAAASPTTTPATTAPPPPPATAAPAPPPPTNNAVTTFPELLKAVAANSKTDGEVLQAVQATGLSSLPLLATRPDLVAVVAQNLGL